MEYRVELDRKIGKKCRKAHILGKIRTHVSLHVVSCFSVLTKYMKGHMK